MHSRFLSFFECVVCHEPQMDNKVLACGHNICHDCLEAYRTQNHRVISCPTCRNTNLFKSQVFKNYKMDEIIRYLKENEFDSFECGCGEYTSKANIFVCNTCPGQTKGCGKCMMLDHSAHDTRLLTLPTKQAIRYALQVGAEDKLEAIKTMFNSYYEKIKSKIAEAKAIEQEALAIHLLDDTALEGFIAKLRTLTGPVDEDLSKVETFMKTITVKIEPESAPPSPSRKRPNNQAIEQLPVQPYRIVPRTLAQALAQHSTQPVGLFHPSQPTLSANTPSTSGPFSLMDYLADDDD